MSDDNNPKILNRTDDETSAAEREAVADFFVFVRWIIFVPAYIGISYAISGPNDFVTYFVGTFASIVVGTLLAPKKRLIIVWILTIFPVISLLFSAIYSEKQTIYMFLACVCAVAFIGAYEKKFGGGSKRVG